MAIAANSSIAEELAPLCDSRATGPATFGRPGIEQTGTPSVRLAKPRWFGPSRIMPSDFGPRGELGLGGAPSLPRLAVAGRQDAALRIPAASASSSAASIPACGTIRNATSTGSPISLHDVTVGWPWVTAPRRLTR